MYMHRKLTGSTIEEMLHPCFRKVDFKEATAVYTVAHNLRRCWVTRPVYDLSQTDESDTSSAVPDQIRVIQETSEEEFEAMRNPDKEQVHTPFRDCIYHVYNHVFWDVKNFLIEAAMDTGHFHPPKHEVFAVMYPEATPGSPAGQGDIVDRFVEERKFNVPVLIIPAYLDPGVKVVFSSGRAVEDVKTMEDKENQDKEEEKEGDSNEGFAFDASGADTLYNGTEVGWIMSGQSIQISLAGNKETRDRRGVAGVFVVGMLCQCAED